MIRRRCKLTQKGQITIPRDIRYALNVAPGDEIEIMMHEGTVTLSPVKPDTPQTVTGRPTTDNRYLRIGARNSIRRFQERLETP